MVTKWINSRSTLDNRPSILTLSRRYFMPCIVETDKEDGWKDYGDLSAVEPPYRVSMACERCKTKWYGCWDNFQCPECGEGELPHAHTVAR